MHPQECQLIFLLVHVKGVEEQMIVPLVKMPVRIPATHIGVPVSVL